MSRLSIGGWQSFGDLVEDKDKCFKILEYCYDNGVNHFDQADNYGYGKSESILGEFLKLCGKREEYLVSTKFGRSPISGVPVDLSYNNAEKSLENSLSRLQLDYVDIYYCHRFDNILSVEAIVENMNRLLDSGRILSWGTSKWPIDKIRQAIEYSKLQGLRAPSFEQTEYSLIRSKIGDFTDIDIGLIGRSPLAMGLLSAKYMDPSLKGGRLKLRNKFYIEYYTDHNNALVRQLNCIAKKFGMTPAQLSLAWTLKDDRFSTIVMGATTLEQASENISAMHIKLPDDLYTIINAMIN